MNHGLQSGLSDAQAGKSRARETRADEVMAEGNAALSAGKFEEAIKHFSDAISSSPSNHVLYSNRSASYASLHKYQEALEDAKKGVELKPDWIKGYSRLGAAFIGLGKHDDAVGAYKKGLEYDPANEGLQSGLSDAQEAKSRAKKKIQKAESLKERSAGNAAYMKRDFDTAVQHFTKAIELNNEDISTIMNRAAACFQMGKYPECIEDCDKAVERGGELHADYKVVARALRRKGTAYLKMAKCAKDYDLAIEAFNEALTKHRDSGILDELNEAESAKRDLEQKEYFDSEIADRERELGNDWFKAEKYPEAGDLYTQVIKGIQKDAKVISLSCRNAHIDKEYLDSEITDRERELGNDWFKAQKYPEAGDLYTQVIKRIQQEAKEHLCLFSEMKREFSGQSGPGNQPTAEASLVQPSAPPLLADENSGSTCEICWHAPAGVCIPCGHFAGCMDCLSELKAKNMDCPVCRVQIQQVVNVYAL